MKLFILIFALLTFNVNAMEIISHGAKNKPISQNIIDNPLVDGFLVLSGWKDIEYSQGVYDWSHIDSEIERAEIAGKKARIAIHVGGDSAPYWLAEDTRLPYVIWYNKKTGDVEYLPAYWDKTYLRYKKKFYRQLGKRYKNNSTVHSFSISMVDPNTGDWAFRADTDEQIQSYLDAGWDEELFISAWENLLLSANLNFGNKLFVTAIGPVPKALTDDKYRAVNEISTWAENSLDGQLLFGKGALHAQTPLPENADGTQWEAMRDYPYTMGQMVWQVTNDPTYKMNGKQPYTDKGAILRRVGDTAKLYNMQWVEIWSVDLLNSDLQDDILYIKNL